jgi:hypothetical protein
MFMCSANLAQPIPATELLPRPGAGGSWWEAGGWFGTGSGLVPLAGTVGRAPFAHRAWWVGGLHVVAWHEGRGVGVRSHALGGRGGCGRSSRVPGWFRRRWDVADGPVGSVGWGGVSRHPAGGPAASTNPNLGTTAHQPARSRIHGETTSPVLGTRQLGRMGPPGGDSGSSDPDPRARWANGARTLTPSRASEWGPNLDREPGERMGPNPDPGARRRRGVRATYRCWQDGQNVVPRPPRVTLRRGVAQRGQGRPAWP